MTLLTYVRNSLRGGQMSSRDDQTGITRRTCMTAAVADTCTLRRREKRREQEKQGRETDHVP
jgi:hypothetical protein